MPRVDDEPKPTIMVSATGPLDAADEAAIADVAQAALRRMNQPKLAVNLYDLGRIFPEVLSALLGDHLTRRHVRMDQEHQDEVGVELDGELLKIAAALDVLRDHDRRAKDHPTRVYLFRKAWTKLPSTAMLTVMEGERVVLNPEWFMVMVESIDAPLPRKRRPSCRE